MALLSQSKTGRLTLDCRILRSTVSQPSTRQGEVFGNTLSMDLPHRRLGHSEEAAGEEEDPEAQLPQTFPHGLHPSSLEPSATDQQYPPITLFPKPLQGNEESYENETP